MFEITQIFPPSSASCQPVTLTFARASTLRECLISALRQLPQADLALIANAAEDEEIRRSRPNPSFEIVEPISARFLTINEYMNEVIKHLGVPIPEFNPTPDHGDEPIIREAK